MPTSVGIFVSYVANFHVGSIFLSQSQFLNSKKSWHESCSTLMQMKTELKGVIMNQHEIISKLSAFKMNLQNFVGRNLHKFFKSESSVDEMNFPIQDAEDNYLDDLPLTINRDPSPGIKFYTTENSEFSRGASKEVPRGIDSFS